MSDVQQSDGDASHDNFSQDDTESASRYRGKQKSSSISGKSSVKKRRSKYDILEEKFNAKLADLDKNVEDKVDKFFSQMSS